MDRTDKLNFDVIIEGTGFVQSLLSAAIAKIGKSVLHIDRNLYYGQDFATFSLKQFLNWINHTENDSSFVNKTIIFCNENFEKTNEKSFNIEISPHLIYSAGKIVNGIKATKIPKYINFCSIEENYILEDDFDKLPMSRSDLFKSRLIDINEKRKLGKILNDLTKKSEKTNSLENYFLSFYGASEEISKYLHKPLINMLENYRLSQKSTDYLAYGCGFLDAKNEKSFAESKFDHLNEKAIKTLPRIKLFLQSTGIFSKGPFIYPRHGSCDLVESFCRVSAVNGTTFALNFRMENFKRELDKYLAQRATEKQNLRKFEFEENQNFHKKIICKSLIIGSNSVPNEYLQIEEPTRQITRAVIISDKSLIGGTNSFVAVKPPKENLFSITIIQLSQDQFVSIENHYIIYMSTTYHENARKEISDLVNKIIKKENLKLFCFFEQMEKIINRNLAKNLKNVCLVDQSSCSIGFNASYRQAEELFAEMFPNKMFLEKRHCDSENEIKEELEEIDVMFEGEKTVSRQKLEFFK